MLTLRIERTKHDRLRAVAEMNHRDVSKEVRMLIDRHLQTYEEEAA